MTVFTVGYQEVRVWQEKGRWVVAVDADIHRGGFMSEAQAAGAGLLRAQQNIRAADERRRVGATVETQAV
jgi:hypothetical protein